MELLEQIGDGEQAVQIWKEGKDTLLVFDVLPVTEDSAIASAINTQPFLFSNEYLNFAMLATCCLEEPAIEVTLLGLGAGTFHRALKKADNFAMIHSVELSSSMIEVAHRYCGVPLSSIKHIDAYEYIKTVQDATQDFLFVDIFNRDGKVPSQFLTSSFLSNCKNTIIMNGIFCMNYIDHGNSEELIDLADNLRAIYGNKSVRIFEYKDNYVFICKVSDEDLSPSILSSNLYYKQSRAVIDYSLWRKEEITYSKMLSILS